jgi:hypothetical protein
MATADQRRAPRLAATCRVEIDDRYGKWSALTEDVGVRGCRLLTARAPRLGALVQLTLRSERLVAPLRMAGQAVWARDGRVGVSFAGPLAGTVTPAAWIRELAAALEEAPAAVPQAARSPGPAPAPRAQPGAAELRPRPIALGAGWTGR